MARFPSIDNTGAFEAPEVRNKIKELVTGSTSGITVDTSVGTRVFVGDTMIHYDSGWRDLFNELPDSAIDKSRGGTFQIRRTLDEVQFFVRCFVSEEYAGRGQGYSILLWDNVHLGFRQTPAIYGTLWYGSTVSKHPIRLSNGSSAAHLRLYRDAGGDWESGYVLSFAGSYTTDRSVPSTSSSLPGTPA